MMGFYLAQGSGKDIVKKVNATFGFNILKKKGAKPSLVYEIDLKNGDGFVKQNQAKNPDATFTMVDGDFVKLCQGKLTG